MLLRRQLLADVEDVDADPVSLRIKIDSHDVDHVFYSTYCKNHYQAFNSVLHEPVDKEKNAYDI